MIQIEQIRNYFPAQIRNNSGLDKFMLKEYLQLMVLDYLSSAELLKTVDLEKKQKDFEHLLFNKANSGSILRFGEFVESLTD